MQNLSSLGRQIVPKSFSLAPLASFIATKQQATL
jgi:hypothetical protein